MRHTVITFSLLLIAPLMTFAASGCRGGGFLPPAGPLAGQQANAVIHDPFPQGDLGPNDLGSRPPSYQTPLPMPVRNRIVPDAMPWLGR